MSQGDNHLREPGLATLMLTTHHGSDAEHEPCLPLKLAIGASQLAVNPLLQSMEHRLPSAPITRPTGREEAVVILH